ncbi:MAG: DNA polymerase III subunit gamma/tau, partial [Motiliproteus sp.]|nr:DNA polymerase III subunit gamma/tau [Motiliproteus sp.]
SFNASLKTLEEPPPHIKFLLATTDPQKLPVTILSRCLQFNLKNMMPEPIVAHLQNVLIEEKVPFDEPALWLLARAANGSMRDAMSLTDQAISYGSGSLVESDVRTMLGSVDQHQVIQLLSLLSEGSAQGVIDMVAKIAEYGADFDDVLAELLGLLHRVAVAQALPDAVDNSQGDREAVLALAKSLKSEDVQLFYQIALNGRKDLPLVPVPKEGFEMTLLRMLAFRPVMPGELAMPQGESMVAPAPAISAPVATAIDTAVGSDEVQPADPHSHPDSSTQQADQPASVEVSPAPTVEVQSAPVASPAVNPAPAVPEATVLLAGNDIQVQNDVVAEAPPVDDTPPWGESASPSSDPPLAEESAPLKKAEPPAAEVEAGQQGGDRVEQPSSVPTQVQLLDSLSWIALLEVIGLSGMTYNIAANASVEAVDSSEQTAEIRFLLPGRQMHLFNGTHKQRIEEGLSNYFKTAIRVDFLEGEPTAETPAQFRERRNKERMAEAVAALQGDANVQAMIQQFDGVLDIRSVQPADPA